LIEDCELQTDGMSLALRHLSGYSTKVSIEVYKFIHLAEVVKYLLRAKSYYLIQTSPKWTVFMISETFPVDFLFLVSSYLIPANAIWLSGPTLASSFLHS
jgi:hypothetical protein